MNLLLPALLALLVTPLAAQTPAPPTQPATQTDGLGFTYRLPEDWEVAPPQAPLPAGQQNEEKETSAADVRQGTACIDVPLTARHGDPPTVVVIVTLPFACYGQTITEQQLPAFGAGAAEGLQQTFDITGPLSASYPLAGHTMWVERARAVPKGSTAPVSTIEIVCTILKKGAVCWMTQAGDDAGLRVFESTPVTLEGDAARALVPADLFLHHR